MKADKPIATFRRLRNEPFWRLLAADNGPIIAGLLQAHFFEGERCSLSASILEERLTRDLEELRSRGENLPQTVQAYMANWVAVGYLERRFPVGETEEVYELSTQAASAIRFLDSLVEPRATATESRLAVVIQQLVRLAEETNADPASRVAALLAERKRIDEEIDAIGQGRLTLLSETRALERVREIITLSADLVGDFRRVRDQFEQLNRDLRERIMDDGGSRGEVLDALFAGVDVIASSEAGRTFSAFWRLLIDPEQSSTLEEALDQVLSRSFAGQLEMRERRFLLRLTPTLLEQGSMVHEVLQHFARSLKQFVQSREYLEYRRVNQLLKEAQRSAVGLKDQISMADNIGYDLLLTSSRVRSLTQWMLYDPSAQALCGSMTDGDAVPISLESVADLVAQSEIDFRSLKANVCTVLCERSQASIGEVMRRFPAAQGLGSLVGYVALGSRHGIMAEGSHETVVWQGTDDQQRSARIPVIYFVRQRADELA